MTVPGELSEFVEEFETSDNRRRRRERQDLTGKKFGYLTAVKFVRKQGKRSYWEFVCDCGTTKVAAAHHVKHGDTISCGCAHLKTRVEQPFAPTRGQIRRDQNSSKRWREKFRRLLAHATIDDIQWVVREIASREQHP